MQLGQRVKYVDAEGAEHSALITQFAPENGASGYKMLDVAYTIDDPSREGNKIPMGVDDVKHEKDAERVVVTPGHKEFNADGSVKAVIDPVTKPVPPYWEELPKK